MDRRRAQLDDLAYQLRNASSISEAKQISAEMSRIRRSIDQDRTAATIASDPTGRSVDLRDLKNEIARNPDPETRKWLREKARKIASEPAHVKDMRTKLVKARRRGDTDEVKSITEFVKSNHRYQ